MSNGVYNRGYSVAQVFDMTNSTFRVMLVSTGYTFNPDHDFVNSNTSSGANGEPKVFEIAPSGYSRQNLTLSRFEDDTNDFAGLDASDTTFTALGSGSTIGGAVIYLYSSSGTLGAGQTTGDSGQNLVAFYDLTDTPTNGGDITIQWASTSAGGVLRFGSTS
jgi:hypothetical protein